MPCCEQVLPVVAVCGGSVAVALMHKASQGCPCQPGLAGVCSPATAVLTHLSWGRWLDVWQPLSVKLNWLRSTRPSAGSAGAAEAAGGAGAGSVSTPAAASTRSSHTAAAHEGYLRPGNSEVA